MAKSGSGAVLLSRPKDESLEAFKAWILEIGKYVNGEEIDDDVSPEQWEAQWKKFWASKKGDKHEQAE